MNDTVSDFAKCITALGFRVYVAEGGRHGFITDDTRARVLSFSFNDGGSLGGNYGPPSMASGTGWRMDQSPWDLKTAEDVRKALYARPQFDCGKGWSRFTTAAEYLAMYDRGSRFAEYVAS